MDIKGRLPLSFLWENSHRRMQSVDPIVELQQTGSQILLCQGMKRVCSKVYWGPAPSLQYTYTQCLSSVVSNLTMFIWRKNAERELVFLWTVSEPSTSPPVGKSELFKSPEFLFLLRALQPFENAPCQTQRANNESDDFSLLSSGSRNCFFYKDEPLTQGIREGISLISSLQCLNEQSFRFI